MYSLLSVLNGYVQAVEAVCPPPHGDAGSILDQNLGTLLMTLLAGQMEGCDLQVEPIMSVSAHLPLR